MTHGTCYWPSFTLWPLAFIRPSFTYGSCYRPSFTHGPCYRPSFTHGSCYRPCFTHGPLPFIRPSFTHAPGPGLLLHMSLDPTPTPAATRLVPQRLPSQPRFPFSALQVVSTHMHLIIVSAISHFLLYKPSASHAGETVYLSRIAHPILWLCYLDLGVLCSLRLSCLQYLTRERVLFIKVYASDWFAHLILRLYYLDLGVLCSLHLSCLQYLTRERVLPFKVYACD